MAGWREEQHQSGVVRGWMVRKVNSKQKNQEEANIKFRQATRSNQVRRDESAATGDEIRRYVGWRCGLHRQDGADYREGGERERLHRRGFRDERSHKPIDRGRKK